MSAPALARFVLLAGVAPVACAPGLGLLAHGPPGLAYGPPDQNPASYAFADTVAFAVDAGAMGVMEVVASQGGIAELLFHGARRELRAWITFPRFDGRFEAAGQGSAHADETHIAGPLLVAVDARGRFEVVDTPGLSPDLLDVTGPDALVRSLFVSLPDREVGPGESWVDTVRTVDVTRGTTSRTRAVVRSTLAGDTMVAGRAMPVIVTAAEMLIEVEGVSGGVVIAQRLTGTVRGRVVWDEARAMLVERRERGELTGTLDMPEAGVAGLTVTARISRSAWLR